MSFAPDYFGRHLLDLGWFDDDLARELPTSSGVDLEATNAASSGESATLSIATALSATNAATSGQAAALRVLVGLAATNGATSGELATMRVALALAAVNAATSGQTATLRAALALVSLDAATSGQAALLRVALGLAASNAATSGELAAVRLTVALAGTDGATSGELANLVILEPLTPLTPFRVATLRLRPHVATVAVATVTATVAIAPNVARLEVATHVATVAVGRHDATLTILPGSGQSIGMSYSIVVGDREPDMEMVCEVNGKPSSLVGALAANLRWKKPDGTISMVGLAIVDAAAGLVRRTWIAGDTDQAGQHLGQVVVTRANGELQTFPNKGWAMWTVAPQLA